MSGAEVDGPYLDGVIWDRPPRPDAVRYEVVHVDDLGCIAEATLPTGETFYGVDAARTRPPPAEMPPT